MKRTESESWKVRTRLSVYLSVCQSVRSKKLLRQTPKQSIIYYVELLLALVKQKKITQICFFVVSERNKFETKEQASD